MKGHIPNEFINQIISTTDIVELISRFVTLKKRGNSHIACCPFHNEKTPSFHVNHNKQIYHCFGCGVGGNVITFLKDHEHLSFVESIEELANIKGQTVPYEKPTSERADHYQDNKEEILSCLSDAQKLFSWNLKNYDDKQQAINYLKQRGISGEIAKSFKIGYAPESWNIVSQNLAKKHSNQILNDAGLIVQKEHKTYDRFRNRIIFPIRNRQGQIIGFGGRIFQSSNDQPKYLNSPETKVFHKGNELYGLYEAKQKIKKFTEILIVEGYMDVISLAQYSYHNSVATLGTALTIDHIKILFRECSTLIFCFDGDSAGLQASMRTVKLILPQLTEVKTAKFLTIPEGEDPDSLIQKEGLEAFQERIQSAETTPEFIISQLSIQFDIKTADGQAKAIILLQQTLSETDGTFSQVTLNLFALKAGLSQTQIIRLFGRKNQPKENLTRQIQFSNINITKLSYTQKILQYILSEPSLAKNIDCSFLEKYHSKGSTLLLETIQRATESENTAVLLNELCEKYPNQQNFLYKLASINPELNKTEVENELHASIKSLKKYYQQKKLEYLVEKSKLYSLSDEEKRELINLLHKELN